MIHVYIKVLQNLGVQKGIDPQKNQIRIFCKVKNTPSFSYFIIYNGKNLKSLKSNI